MSNFSFSQSVFIRLILQTRKNQVLFGKELTTLYEKQFENIVWKGENAGDQHFLLFPTTFSTLPETFFFSIFESYYFFRLQKFCRLVKSNFLPNGNFFDWSKLKAFADDKVDIT